MSWLPWTLEYVKQGIEYAAREAAKRAAEKVGDGDKGKDEPHPKAQERNLLQNGGRATIDDRQRALEHLKRQGFDPDKVWLAPPGAIYFNQGAYKKVKFPKIGENPETSTRTLKSGGCGPTSLAIAIATLRPGTKTTPREIAAFAVKEGYSSPRSKPTGRGADMSMVKLVAKDHGLTSVKINDKDKHTRVDRLREELKQGGVAVVHVEPGIFNYPDHNPNRTGDNGHWIAVNGYAVDEAGNEWFFVANPGNANPLRDGSPELFASKGLVIDDTLHPGAGMVRVSRETLEGLIQESYVVKEKEPAAKPASQEATPGG